MKIIFFLPPSDLKVFVRKFQSYDDNLQTLLLVYWELVQIYDGQNERLMDQYSEQLVRFGKCSPVRMALLQKIKDYEPQSRFKKYIRRTDRELRGEKGLFSIFKAS